MTKQRKNNHYVIFIYFSVYFLRSHTLPRNTMYLPFIIFQCIDSVYSWFFLINDLIKTGIGQSKYRCIPQPFSHCLISLRRSLSDFNSIFIFSQFRLITILLKFDPTFSYIDRSRFLQWFFKP